MSMFAMIVGVDSIPTTYTESKFINYFTCEDVCSIRICWSCHAKRHLGLVTAQNIEADHEYDG